jgi:hypothetical protein
VAESNFSRPGPESMAPKVFLVDFVRAENLCRKLSFQARILALFTDGPHAR